MSTQVVDPPPAPPSHTRGGDRRLTPARAGWAGVALGFLALFVAVPPALIRSPVPSILLGVLGLAAGAWALRGGEKRLGWGAIVAAVAGVALGWAATKSGEANLRNV